MEARLSTVSHLHAVPHHQKEDADFALALAPGIYLPAIAMSLDHELVDEVQIHTLSRQKIVTVSSLLGCYAYENPGLKEE